MPTKERATADAIIAAFNAQDLPLIISLRTPTCLRHFLPASLNFPPQSNTQYLANLTQMQSLFTAFHLTVTDVLEDQEQRKIAMWVRAEGETCVGKYENEYVWKMEFEEGGGKVCEWSEFVDVGMVRDFLPRLREVMGGRKGNDDTVENGKEKNLDADGEGTKTDEELGDEKGKVEDGKIVETVKNEEHGWKRMLRKRKRKVES